MEPQGVRRDGGVEGDGGVGLAEPDEGTQRGADEGEVGGVGEEGLVEGARIKGGDNVRARIEGVGTLSATVRQGTRQTVIR